MARFLVDEDLPRSLARELRAAGVDAADVRDVGLRGRSDSDVFAFAVSDSRALLTGDVLGLAAGTHHGVLVARFPNETPVRTLNDAMLAAIRALTDEDIEQAVVIVEPGRIRLRRSR